MQHPEMPKQGRAQTQFEWDTKGCAFMAVSLRPTGLGRQPPTGRCPAYLPLMAIRLTLCCASGDFGRITVSTPFLNEAETLSCSM
jgi:hypothetical protein